MRKLIVIVLAAMALAKLLSGRAIPPDVRVTSSAGFNLLADPAPGAEHTAPKRAPHAHPKGERHFEPAWLPARYEPGTWLNKPVAQATNRVVPASALQAQRPQAPVVPPEP